MVAGASRTRRARIGREIEVFTVGQVVCRPTQKEAEDYYHYAIIEMADWGSVDRMMEIKNMTPQTLGEKAMPRSASISPRARSAAIRSSARPTASPRSWPI